jgi:hypothetical protein
MYGVPQAGLTVPAVVGQLERGVRPRCRGSEVAESWRRGLWRQRYLTATRMPRPVNAVQRSTAMLRPIATHAAA